jgi:hypothetical protein
MCLRTRHGLADTTTVPQAALDPIQAIPDKTSLAVRPQNRSRGR